VSDFEDRNRVMVGRMAADDDLKRMSHDWLMATARFEYSYHFRWLGLPIIQYPHDVLAMQELIWETKPDLIVETGIARGGSLVFYASMLQLLGGDRRVIGIDIDIRPDNRAAIESHPMAVRIDMVEGSSVEREIVDRVHEMAAGRESVLVVLDSHHTHDHVFQELQSYAPLVRPGGYLVVFDTSIEAMPAGSFPDRPWEKGDNPATAVQAFLDTTDRFEVDRSIDDKLLVSVAPGGYLRCVKA
jgi:cephalosporin hydroxylase